MIDWEIFYEDGTTLTGSGRPEPGIKTRGIEAILVLNDQAVGVEILQGADYWIWKSDEEGWLPVDLFGLYDWLLDRGNILFGRMIHRDAFDAIMQRVIDEKHGWTARERRMGTMRRAKE